MIHRVASEMFQQVLTQVQLSVITVLVRFGGGVKMSRLRRHRRVQIVGSNSQ